MYYDFKVNGNCEDLTSFAKHMYSARSSLCHTTFTRTQHKNLHLLTLELLDSDNPVKGALGPDTRNMEPHHFLENMRVI